MQRAASLCQISSATLRDVVFRTPVPIWDVTVNLRSVSSRNASAISISAGDAASNIGSNRPIAATPFFGSRLKQVEPAQVGELDVGLPIERRPRFAADAETVLSGFMAGDAHEHTGTRASIGERLKAAEPLLAGESCFLANYADGLSDLPLPELIDFHRRQDALATFLAVRPKQSFHAVAADSKGFVENIAPISESDVWMNGGYFVLDHRIFDYLHAGEDLVEQPFRRLIAGRRLAAYRYDGFWCCMDTHKELQTLEDMVIRGETRWKVWKHRDRPACLDLLPAPPLMGVTV